MTNASSWVTSDQPITSRSQDGLARGEFTHSIAEAIIQWAGQDSLVVAIYGDWGTGKTSAKNLIVEDLTERTPTPTIVDFNPWQWASQDRVAEAFFEEVRVALGRIKKGEKDAHLAKRWEALADKLEIGSYVVSGLPRTIATAVPSGLVAALFLSHWVKVPAISSGTSQSIVLVLTGLYLSAGAMLSFFQGLASRFAAFFDRSARLSTQSLQEVREELAECFKKLSLPVVVIIDDIDRLTPAEIRLVFQLVKANANFPNLVYLLLFQRTVVEESLSTPEGGVYTGQFDGRQFMEKIVQVGFDLPPPTGRKLRKDLTAGLDEILADQTVSSRFDRTRWSAIFLGGVEPYFGTLRSVKRFLATFRFHVAQFRSAPHSRSTRST